MEWLDYIAEESVKIWGALQISYTDFIRTTEADHQAFVQKVLKGVYEEKDSRKKEKDSDF